MPEGIRLVIGRRVQRLSAEHRRLLTTAAVVGRSFDLTLLEALGDADEDAVLTALEAAKLILTMSSGRVVRWEFAHGLIRQTLEHSLSLPRRQRAHLRVADALERIHGANADRYASDLAHHLYQVGAAADPDKTVRYMTTAGDQALEAGAFDEALRQFDEALFVSEEQDEKDADGQQRRADLRDKKGQALRRLSRGDEAVAEWEAALDSYEILEDDSGIARATEGAFFAHGWGGDVAAARHVGAARQVAERGLAALTADSVAERALLLSLTGLSLSVSARPGGAVLINEAVSLTADIDDDRLRSEVLVHKAMHHLFFLEVRDTVATGRQAAALCRSTSNLWALADVLTHMRAALLFRGELVEFVDLGEEVETVARRAGHIDAAWLAGTHRAPHDLMVSGNLDEFEQFALRDIDYTGRAKLGWRFFSPASLGLVHLLKGRPPGSAERVSRGSRSRTGRSALGRVEHSGSFPRRGVRPGGRCGREARARAGRTHEASRGPHGRPLGTPGRRVVEGLATLGKRAQTAELYPLVVNGISRGIVVNLADLRLLQTLAGMAAAARQHWDAAQEHFETALRHAHDLPNRIAQPEVRRWYAWMLLDRNAPGAHDKARTMLGEAVEMYQRIGMPRHVEMAEELRNS